MAASGGDAKLFARVRAPRVNVLSAPVLLLLLPSVPME